jgi:hypothetical protein
VNILLTALCLLGTAAEPAPAWPLELPPQLTSSFGEYRPGRFHAGIDLRTQGIGRPVAAAADGYISRVRCAPSGYGKAIYLQTDGGYTAVYAHLDDYFPALRDWVRAQQHRRKAYTVDLTPDSGVFRVARGQEIAKSGQTGIGAPHLHYELRDRAQRPLNPRLCGVVWPDETPPEIRKVVIAPLDGTVNGDMLPVVLDAVYQGDGRYTCAAVHARGRIIAGVDARDPGSGGYQLGIAAARLAVDNVSHFEVHHERLSYDNHRNAAVAWHPYLMDRGRFLLLWRWPGNVCASYGYTAGDGAAAMGVQERVLRVDAGDFMGNSVFAEIAVKPEQAAAEPAGDAVSGGGNVTLDCYGTSLLISAAFDGSEGEAPVLMIDSGGDITAQVFIRINDSLFRARFVPGKSGLYRLSAAHPRIAAAVHPVIAAVRGDGCRYMLDGVRFECAPDTPYGVLFIRAESARVEAPPGLRDFGRAWRILPEASPADAPVHIAFPAPEGVYQREKVHAYRKSGKSWRRAATEYREGMFTISTRDFGGYALMEDTAPPVIDKVNPVDGFKAAGKRPVIEAFIDDSGSGIAAWSVHCGETWLLTAWDPEQKHLAWERDEDLPAGRRTITIAVTDHAGNRREIKRVIHIPE